MHVILIQITGHNSFCVMYTLYRYGVYVFLSLVFFLAIKYCALVLLTRLNSFQFLTRRCLSEIKAKEKAKNRTYEQKHTEVNYFMFIFCCLFPFQKEQCTFVRGNFVFILTHGIFELYSNASQCVCLYGVFKLSLKSMNFQEKSFSVILVAV